MDAEPVGKEFAAYGRHRTAAIRRDLSSHVAPQPCTCSMADGQDTGLAALHRLGHGGASSAFWMEDPRDCLCTGPCGAGVDCFGCNVEKPLGVISLLLQTSA